MADLGCATTRVEVVGALGRHFGRVFNCEIIQAVREMESVS
jgi:predicted phage tail protein